MLWFQRFANQKVWVTKKGKKTFKTAEFLLLFGHPTKQQE
jgi:hypothetical protein